MADALIRRRGFLAGLGALLAAPAIVRFRSLMPVVSIRFQPSLVSLPTLDTGYAPEWRHVEHSLGFRLTNPRALAAWQKLQDQRQTALAARMAETRLWSENRPSVTWKPTLIEGSTLDTRPTGDLALRWSWPDGREPYDDPVLGWFGEEGVG